MNAARLLRTPATVTRRSAGAPDIYNDPTVVDADPESTLVAIQPVTVDEQTAGANLQSEDWLVWFLPGFDVEGIDAVTAPAGSGRTYELIGPPATWTNPRTLVDEYIEARAKRVS